MKAFASTCPYVDGWSVHVQCPHLTPSAVIDAFFSASPAWVDTLIVMRNAVVKRLGLKATTEKPRTGARAWQTGDRIGAFRVFDIRDSDVVLGEDDRHLDFRTSLHWHAETGGVRLYVNNAVTPHNLAGRCYLALVTPLHRHIVPLMTRRMSIVLAANHADGV
ncbi:MAG: DUF2867 domain-containing protein [Cupriavidus sp.]|nr:DUF2867 domain-containing protein [Cupriavidus sp.]